MTSGQAPVPALFSGNHRGLPRREADFALAPHFLRLAGTRGVPDTSNSPLVKPREEAVQGAGMGGPFPAPGAAESDASVRLAVGANNHSPVRSHGPGTRRDRAPAEEAGSEKAKP